MVACTQKSNRTTFLHFAPVHHPTSKHSPSSAIKVVNERVFIEHALPEIARIGGSTEKHKSRTAMRLGKIAQNSEDLRRTLESIGIDSSSEVSQNESEDARTGNEVDKQISSVVSGTSTSGASSGLKLAQELLKVHESKRTVFTLANYARLFTEIHLGLAGSADSKVALRNSPLFERAVEDVLGTWRKPGMQFSNGRPRDYVDCLLALHRMRVKPKNHVLQLLLVTVRRSEYDFEAMEKLFLTDFLNHPSTFVRIELLREIGRHRHMHIFKGRSKKSLRQHKGLLELIEQFSNHPGPDMRANMLFFWNGFVSLIDSGRVEYREGANKDKIALLHRLNTLAKFDPFINIHKNQPQTRMALLKEEDARHCEEVAIERQEERMKFSMLLRDKADTLLEISEVLTSLNFENSVDVPISSDGFTHGGGNLPPVTGGSGFNVDVAHVTGWRRIAVCYVNDFRHEYQCYTKNRGGGGKEGMERGGGREVRKGRGGLKGGGLERVY
jgi:hypothetical protein